MSRACRGHVPPDVPALCIEALDWLGKEAGPSQLPSNGALTPPLVSFLACWLQDYGERLVFVAAKGLGL